MRAGDPSRMLGSRTEMGNARLGPVPLLRASGLGGIWELGEWDSQEWGMRFVSGVERGEVTWRPTDRKAVNWAGWDANAVNCCTVRHVVVVG